MDSTTIAGTQQLLFQVLKFTNTFPFPIDNPDREETILKEIDNFYTFLQKYDTEDYKFKVTANLNGETIDIIDRSDITIKRLFNELLASLTWAGASRLLEMSTSLLQVEEVKFFHKTHILDAENTFFKEVIENIIDEGDPNVAYQFVATRLKITSDSIYRYDDLIKDSHHFNQDKSAFYHNFGIYLSYMSLYHLSRNQIFQFYDYLKTQLSDNTDSQIRTIFLRRIIAMNSSFLLEPLSITHDLVDQNAASLNETEQRELRADADPRFMDVEGLQYVEGNLLSDEVHNNRIHTIIQFTIPHSVRNEKSGTIYRDNAVQIDFEEMINRFVDPVLKHFPFSAIGGMGLQYFSDIRDFGNAYTLIRLTVLDFYAPDMELINNEFVKIDFKERRALIGRGYYPHKEFVIQQLLKHANLVCNKINLEHEKISINLFSNFSVTYINTDTMSILCRKLYIMTNPESYKATSNMFLERLNELNLTDAYVPIRKIIERSNLTTDRGLSLFIQTLLEVVVKNNVELHSNYRYFWKLSKEGVLHPQSEPEMQPLIMSQLKGICDYMGIQISREVESANGEIDFVCSATHEGKIVKTCVELKNAHNPNIERGITHQLPQYLRSERTRSGIYVILWYKGDSFGSPTNYASPEDLFSRLELIKPKEFDISVTIINCSKPVVPSKMK